MTSALAQADAATWLAIAVKALVYAAILLAMGSVTVLLALRRLPDCERRILRRWAVFWAIGAAVLSVARLPLRASFLMGGTLQGAMDPVMLRLAAESPLGDSLALRLVGLALICGLLVPRRAGLWLAGGGVVLVALSFVLRGHALEEPRPLLSALITLHLLGLAFWVGAFAPLYRLAGHGNGLAAALLAEEFGRLAVWVVGGLALAGAVTLWLLVGTPLRALATPYGQFLALKLVLFAAILGLAAWNKLRLTPALSRHDPGAGARLRRSIRAEAALVAFVLLTTAALTTLSAPAKTALLDGLDRVAWAMFT
jgi:putative copper resistance protein D